MSEPRSDLIELVAKYLCASFHNEVPHGIAIEEFWPQEQVLWRGDATTLMATGEMDRVLGHLERRAFERGANPAVGALLAEVTNTPEGQYRLGLERAIEVLIQSWVDNYNDAFARGLREGERRARVNQED